MAWQHATRQRDGVLERRCGHARHQGARWLTLDLTNFHSLRGHYCIDCQRLAARETWRRNHPGCRPRHLRTQTRRAAAKAREAAARALTNALLAWR